MASRRRACFSCIMKPDSARTLTRFGLFRKQKRGTTMQTIKFDDVAALTAKISKEFGPWSEPIRVTQEKINQFADVTGDHQWIHIDVERCTKESPFAAPLAHGFLTPTPSAASTTSKDVA